VAAVVLVPMRLLRFPQGAAVVGWQALVVAAAVAATVLTVWVTLDADFLAYSGWLAAQKADFVVGPVLIGLYWVRRRPRSHFGPLLIVFGFVGAMYVLQSSSNPWLFGAGLVWENVIYLATLALILAFPTGHLAGAAAKLILVAAFLFAALPATMIVLVLPETAAGGSISGCRGACPRNALALTSQPSLALSLSDIFRVGAIAVAIATCVLLLWRLVSGTAPQRRALAIGTSIAIVFLLGQITFLALTFLAPGTTALQAAIRWAFAGARAAIWYGFLIALVAAQLFAGRALRQLVRQSLRRPSLGELEAMLREPLGDPELALAFWDAKAGTWAPPLPQPGPGRDLAIVARDDTPAVAMLHDAQLNDDPELLQAAGAVALLAAENAELDRGWSHAVQELVESRARIVRAADSERQKVERNLHDGVQQQLVAVGIGLGIMGDQTPRDSPLRATIDEIGQRVEEALEDLREVAHGLYPPVLSDLGLFAALKHVRVPANARLSVSERGLRRHPADLESAVYYCCLEAIQNATKHSDGAVNIHVSLRQDADELSFEVSDDGPGFEPVAVTAGTGLQNMRDRLGGLSGRLSIVSSPGDGTTVTGSIPLRPGEPADAGGHAASSAPDAPPRPH
jgi:signal transduction histidine kinase